MSDQYGIVGSAVTLACVGISPGGNKPTLSIYKGESLLARSEDPQLTSVNFSKSQQNCLWLTYHFQIFNFIILIFNAVHLNQAYSNKNNIMKKQFEAGNNEIEFKF